MGLGCADQDELTVRRLPGYSHRLLSGYHKLSRTGRSRMTLSGADICRVPQRAGPGLGVPMAPPYPEELLVESGRLCDKPR